MTCALRKDMRLPKGQDPSYLQNESVLTTPAVVVSWRSQGSLVEAKGLAAESQGRCLWHNPHLYIVRAPYHQPTVDRS